MLKSYKIKSLTKKLKALRQARLLSPAKEEDLLQETNMYWTLAATYSSLKGHKKYPFAEQAQRECWRLGAELDDTRAQFKLAQILLDEAKFRQGLEQESVLSNKINQRIMQQCYEEAHAYLLAAQRLGHAQAKRLQGLCYINGWGVEIDRSKGFQMIVASIDQENSWDKVPQIFAEIGLNKPEFFSALNKHRKDI